MAASISSDDLKTRSYTNLYSHTTFSDNSEDNNNNNDDDDTSKDSTASSDTSKDICSGSDASSDTCNKDDSVSGGHVLSDTLLRPKRHVRSNLRRAPSQLNMHHTTVPQALVPSQLGSRHAPTRSSLRHSRIMSSKQASMISSSYKRLDTRWVWLGLAQLLLATISILATITIMATIHFSSTYNWTFYSGPWVLLSSFLILFYYWFNYKNTLSSSPAYIVQPQELECRKLELSCILVNCFTFLYCMSSLITLLVQIIKYVTSFNCVNIIDCNNLSNIVIPIMICHIVCDLLFCVIFIIILVQNNSVLSSWSNWKYNPAYQKSHTLSFNQSTVSDV